MATVTARPVKKERRKGNRPGSAWPSAPRPIPPPVTIYPKQENLDRRIRNLEALGDGVFIGNVLASYMALPGLVGFWPMSSVQRSTGNAYDLSGQARTLSYAGNPAYTYYNGLVPYIDLDGTGDYLGRNDETDLDILGTETIYTTGAAGLTQVGWFRPDTLAPGIALALMAKSDNNTQKSWDMFEATTGTITARISDDGTAITSVVSAVLTNTDWVFVCMRYIPSDSLSIFVNNIAVTNTTSIPAAIFNSTSAFTIGAFSGGGNAFFGHATLCALCANALGDDLISSLYQSSRVLFGV